MSSAVCRPMAKSLLCHHCRRSTSVRHHRRPASVCRLRIALTTWRQPQAGCNTFGRQADPILLVGWHHNASIQVCYPALSQTPATTTTYSAPVFRRDRRRNETRFRPIAPLPCKWRLTRQTRFRWHNPCRPACASANDQRPPFRPSSKVLVNPRWPLPTRQPRTGSNRCETPEPPAHA